MKTLGCLAALLLAACAATPDAPTAPASAPTTAQAPGRRATVNGVELYYEVHGTGRPMVLLHGAFCTIEVCFGKLIPELAEHRQVIAVELQAHGHTADIDRPLTYPALDRARRILWLVTGEDKAEVVRMLRDHDGSIPAGRVSDDRALQLADEAAASSL